MTDIRTTRSIGRNRVRKRGQRKWPEWGSLWNVSRTSLIIPLWASVPHTFEWEAIISFSWWKNRHSSMTQPSLLLSPIRHYGRTLYTSVCHTGESYDHLLIHFSISKQNIHIMIIGRCHGNGQNCPSRSHAVWEMVMNELDRRDDPSFDEELAGCAMVDACSNIISGEQLYNFLNHNFERHYKTNRAPLGLYFHASWLKQNPEYLDAFLQWVDEMLEKNDVYFVTMTQVSWDR